VDTRPYRAGVHTQFEYVVRGCCRGPELEGADDVGLAYFPVILGALRATRQSANQPTVVGCLLDSSYSGVFCCFSFFPAWARQGIVLHPRSFDRIHQGLLPRSAKSVTLRWGDSRASFPASLAYSNALVSLCFVVFVGVLQAVGGIMRSWAPGGRGVRTHQTSTDKRQLQRLQ